MAEWYIRFKNRNTEQYVGTYTLQHPEIEIHNSQPGTFTGELALSQHKRGLTTTTITRDEFVPYEVMFEIWREGAGSGICIMEGELTSINLNFNRDTVLLSGHDWIGYLNRRIYPFNPELYVSGDWVRWPRRWPDMRGTHGPVAPNDNPVDVSIIVRQIVQSMRYEPPTEEPPIGYTWPAIQNDIIFGSVPITQNIPVLGKTTRYAIFPGDSTTIFDHITKLSEQTDAGFEFDITPLDREFKLWNPRRDSQQIPVYTFRPNLNDETTGGAIIEFDWTNDGPDGTYLVGLATAGKKVGAVWEDLDSTERWGRHDLVYDYGAIQNENMILELLQDQNDLHPQKRLGLTLSNPEYLTPNFYTGGRPRELIGARVFVQHDFAPLHLVHAYFRINGIKWSIDASTNENVTLELEMVYEP
jgi:hypothetical protein